MTFDPDAARSELRDLLQQLAFTFGSFTLASGRHSDFYFDGRQVTLHARGIYLTAQLILQRCREINVSAIGGLTLGADPIVGAVAALSGGDGGEPINAFIVRKQTKDHGTGRLIEGPELSAGQRVALVDDTTTTGSSYVAAADAVRPLGVEIVEAIAIVDRQEGAREVLAQHGVVLHALFGREEFSAAG